MACRSPQHTCARTSSEMPEVIVNVGPSSSSSSTTAAARFAGDEAASAFILKCSTTARTSRGEMWNSSASAYVFASLSAALPSRDLRGRQERSGKERNVRDGKRGASSRNRKKNARRKTLHATLLHATLVRLHVQQTRLTPISLGITHLASFSRRKNFCRDFAGKQTVIPRSKISTRPHERRSAVASNFTAFSRSVSILARQSSRARRADEPELRHLFRVRGSRWRSPSRSRLVVGTTQPRRSRSARLGRLARTASKRRRKNKKETLLFRLSSDAILATLASTRNERVPPAISL